MLKAARQRLLVSIARLPPTTMDLDNAGGFLQPALLSPPLTAQTSSATSGVVLPHTRGHPLKPGGSKESSFIRYVDQDILKIQRRYANRGSEELGQQIERDAQGYESFVEVAKDMERLIDLIWVSGTPALQVPYFLHIAMLVKQYLPSFGPAPKATFHLIGKLDLAFASLLQGRHAETGEQLPGFEGGRGISGTEKVRLKSIVDQTRIVVAEVMEEPDIDELDNVDAEDVDEGFDMDVDLAEAGEGPEEITDREMGVVKVYDRCIVELGDSLGDAPIGIISDD